MGLAALIALPVLLSALTATPALAARKHRSHRAAVSATDPAKDAALVIDGASGKVLFARNEMAARHPASLTKMMTLYLLFDALRHGKLTLQTPLPVSRHAALQKPTRLALRTGQTITVDQAIRAIVIRSANDVAVVIAEALGGTESHFAMLMTERARKMGMNDTNFHNASGLPDPLQISTAHDLAILGRRLAYDFPEYFNYFALSGFSYKGSWYPTHDNLIGKYDGADGIKTGYTNASGFNLVSSVVRGKTHLIAVVMGGRTAARRDREMMKLLDQTFARIADNPAMVAQVSVPWHKDGEATAPVLMAKAGSAVAANTPGASSPALPLVPALRPTPRPMAAPVTATAAPAAAPAAAPVKLAALAPTPRPAARAAGAEVPLPSMRPSLTGGDPANVDIAEGDIDTPGAQPGKNWTIQIGAYADRALASAQLAAYAGKAQDMLASATRIIDPVRSAAGHTLYRARFGLYAEREARTVCSRLTERGQTCFAAIEAR